jgi:hypothetical protein
MKTFNLTVRYLATEELTITAKNEKEALKKWQKMKVNKNNLTLDDPEVDIEAEEEE